MSGHFYVVRIGRRYLRDLETEGFLFVTRQLEFAARVPTKREALSCRDRLRNDPELDRKIKAKGIDAIEVVIREVQS